MKIRVTIKNSNDIKFYSPDSNWTSFIATVRDVLEESQNKTANLMIHMSPTIKAAGIVSFEPKTKGDFILMGSLYQVVAGRRHKRFFHRSRIGIDLASG